MSNNQIKSIIDRALRIHQERDASAADLSELMAEAKSNGFDRAAIKAAVAHLRKVDRVGASVMSEHDAIVETYLRAHSDAP
jgi:uncharacterized protein (UPF0335 family)